MAEEKSPNWFMVVALVASGSMMGGGIGGQFNSPHELIDNNHLELQFEIKELRSRVDQCRLDIRYLNRMNNPETPYFVDPMRSNFDE